MPDDFYTERARAGISPTEIAGRYASQERDERAIVRDVAEKLELSPDDELLEIGCGPGTLLIPLSFQCASATGIDQASVIESLRQRFAGPPSIRAVVGAFPDDMPPGSFDAIVVYSVLHALPAPEMAMAFSLAAAARLRPGGRLLLGDLPNIDKKRRYFRSPAGLRFQDEWEARQRATPPTEIGSYSPPCIGTFDDEWIMDLLRSIRGAGYEAFLLGQPLDLPFGRTREDVLVRAHR